MPSARSSGQSHESIQRWLLDIPSDIGNLAEQNRGKDGNAQREQHRKVSTTPAKARIDGHAPSMGSNSHTPHRSALYRTSHYPKDNRKPSAWQENHESPDRHDAHIGHSKRRHSISVQRQDIGRRKRRKAVNECPVVSQNSSLRPSSPASSFKSPEALPLSKETLGHRSMGLGQYERRPRHRTKADKYDLKTRAKSSEARDTVGGERKSRRRRRRKSGLVPNSDFKAPNVAQERLTLKANSGPGIFHKGKASSPIRIRGMPDLTFTEMNFLSKQRNHQEPNKSKPKHTGSSKCKEKEKSRAEQISEYFQHSPAADPCLESRVQAATPEQNTTQHSPATSSTSLSNHLDLDLNHRQPAPANHGLRRHSAQQKDCKASATQKYRTPYIEQPGTENRQRHSSLVNNDDQLKSHSSYCSWYVTPSRQCKSPQEATTKPTKTIVQISHPDGFCAMAKQQHAEHSRSIRSPHGQNVTEPVRESSVSQLSLDEYTKSMLLGSKQDLWSNLPTNYRAAELYTLTDLKGLARLGRLEGPGKEGHDWQSEDQRRMLYPINTGLRFDADLSNTKTENMSTTQKEPSKIADNGSKNGQHLPPQMQPPDPSTLMKDHPAGQISEWDMLADLPDKIFAPVRHHGMFAPSGSRDRPASEQSRGYPSFEQKNAELPPRTIRSANAIQPGLHKHQRTNTSGRLPQNPPAKDTAQQIIQDIEQEELLISQANNYKARAVEDVVDIAMDGFSDPTSRTDLPGSHEMGGGHDSVPLPQYSEYAEQNINRLPSGAASAQPEPSPQQPYLAPGRMTADRPQNQCRPKIVRFTTDQQSEWRSPAVNDGGVLAEQQKRQQQQEKEEKEETELVNFWRPNILY